MKGATVTAEVPAALAQDFDLATVSAAFIADPFPTYRALRTHAPVKRMPDGSMFLTRYADLETVYRDTKTFSSDKREEFAPKFGASLTYEHHTTSLVFNDPPLHTQVRRILQGALTPRAIGHMEAGLTALVDRLLDDAADRNEIDLIEDFASAIPIEVIGNLLGVPHADRGPLRQWSLDVLGALEPVTSPAMLQRADDSIADFLAYLEVLVADRRAHLGDPDIDVLSRLILGETDGARLGERELLQNCVFLLNAGHETTTNLIGNALVVLTQWPDQKRRLLEDIDGQIGTAIEEVLRFESSNQLGNRRTTVDAEVGGVTLPAGALLTLCIGAANRDPAQFTDPEVFDIGRKPNRHLAFASGPHLCLGLNLARLESRTAIGRLLKRFPDYELTEPPVRSGRVRFRGFTSIPARLARSRPI